MKLAAAVLAAAMSAAPAFAGRWYPEAASFKLDAIGIPPAPAPIKNSPRDGVNYSGAEELLIKEFGIPRIGMDIPETEVIRQDRFYGNTFCFEHALRLALTDLLENYDNSSSPLAKILGEMGVISKPTKSQLLKARQMVLALLDSPASRISLVRPYEQNQPRNGEAVEKNWVFFLSIRSDSYWVIVDRSGKNPSYTYGR